MITTDTLMAEPVADSRQERSASPQDGLPSTRPIADKWLGRDDIAKYRVPDAAQLIRQLSPQETAIVDELIFRYNLPQIAERLNLPKSWVAYAVEVEDWFASEQDRAGKKLWRRRRAVDEVTERWIAAVGQLIRHQFINPTMGSPETAESVDLAVPRIAPETIAEDDDLPDDLMELAQRLAEGARRLAMTPRAQDLVEEDDENDSILGERFALPAESPISRRSSIESLLSTVWRYVRTGQWSEATPHPEGPHVRMQLVGADGQVIDELLPLEAAAAYLGVSRGRISQLVNDGTIAKHPLGDRFYLLAKGDLDRYAESSRRIPNRGPVPKPPSSRIAQQPEALPLLDPLRPESPAPRRTTPQ